MRTVRTKVCKFDELSEPAKEKARQWFRNGNHTYGYAWDKENTDSLEKFIEIFPCELSRSGESLIFTGDDDHENLTGQRLATYIWNNYGKYLYTGKYYSLWSKTEKSYKYYPEGFPVLKSRHSKVLFEFSCPLTGTWIDNEILLPIIDFMKKPDDRTTFGRLLDECLDAWSTAVDRDREDQDSDESVDENIRANDYEFYQDGRKF